MFNHCYLETKKYISLKYDLKYMFVEVINLEITKYIWF